MTSADNQQERLQYISDDLGHYLSGFADGEGSFNISLIRRNLDYKSGWKIVTRFSISQRDDTLLKLFQTVLDCGAVRYRRDEICYLEVSKVADININVREFFRRFPLRSERQSTRLILLLEAVDLIVRGEHLTCEGLKAVLMIREQMVSNRPRKYEITDVL